MFKRVLATTFAINVMHLASAYEWGIGDRLFSNKKYKGSGGYLGGVDKFLGFYKYSYDGLIYGKSWSGTTSGYREDELQDPANFRKQAAAAEPK